jgi:hypothetical protein
MRSVRGYAAAVGVLLLAAGATSAQVLQQVPSDALVVVKISNLKQTSDKVADMANRFGIAGFVPQSADPLGSLQQNFKLTNGVNTAGDAALVMLDAGQGGSAKERAARESLLLIPVSDYKAFVANFSKPTEETDQPAAADNNNAGGAPAKAAAAAVDADGIAKVAFPSSFETSYVAQWGDYAAISGDRAALTRKGQGLKVQGLADKQMQSHDFVVFANVPALRAKALPKLKANRQKAIDQVNKAMAANPQNKAFAPLANIVVGQLMDGAERFLTDAQAATYGISLSKDGIKTTLLGEFTPDSQLGKSVASVKNSSDPLLAGLPEGKYLFYGGMSWDPQAVGQIFDQLVTPAKAELAKGGDQTKPFVQLVDAWRTMITATKAQSFGMVAPTGQIGQESIIQVLNVTTGDAKAIAAAQKTLFELQAEIMKLANNANNTVTTTWTANAKQIDGVSFDQFQTKFDMKPKTPQEMQAAQAMTMMYGPNGVNGVAGVVDPQHFIGAVGVSDDVLAKAVEAAKAGQDNLSKQPPLTVVQQNLPQNRVAAFYVPLDQIVSTAATYAKQFGMPVQLQLPPNLPPVGITAGTEQSAVRVDTYIPAQTVQSLIAAGMQAMMAVQGGQQPGGPGGL